MDLVLYTHKHEKLHPVSLFTKSLCKLSNIPLKVVRSQYSWTCVGDLPVLKLNQFLFPSHRIIQVLKKIIDVDGEVETGELNRNLLIEEVLFKKLHAGTAFLRSFPFTPSDQFFGLFEGFWRFVGWTTRLRVDEGSYVKFSNEKQVFGAFEETYKILSEALMGNELFSGDKRKLGIRTIDLVVYSYLKEHLFYLEMFENVQEGIGKYKGILNFILRVEERLCKDRVEAEVVLDNNFLAALSFKQDNQVEIKQKDPHKENRKLFVTSTAFILSTYLLLTTS